MAWTAMAVTQRCGQRIAVRQERAIAKTVNASEQLAHGPKIRAEEGPLQGRVKGLHYLDDAEDPRDKHSFPYAFSFHPWILVAVGETLPLVPSLNLVSACSFWGLDQWGLDPKGCYKTKFIKSHQNSSKVIKSYQNSSKVIKSLKSELI